jgi:DNA mismatch repair protein MutL
MGFSIEPFGKNTFKIDALPQIASDISPSALLSTICHDLSEGNSKNSSLRWKEEIIAKSVARSFIGAHQKLSAEGAVQLMEELCSCKMPYVCPRGKSVMIFTSNRELDRKFDRK